MKKIILLVLSLLFLTGCTVTKLDSNIESNVNKILSLDLKLSNSSKNGYKYYLPKGVSVVDNTDYNETLVSGGDTYYLYVDIVSKHYKSKLNYQINPNAYKSMKLEQNKKEGYLEINQKNNLYLIEMVYNYAKIKTYVPKERLSDSLINISYILSTMNYNNTIIDLLFSSESYQLNKEKFSLFDSTRENGKFSDYVIEFDKDIGDITEDITEDNTSVDIQNTTE